MKRVFSVFVLVIAASLLIAGCSKTAEDNRIPVKVLILSAFEVERMAGDFPGEAQFYYEAYLQGGEKYEVEGCAENPNLYYKDGVALGILGEGKVSSALNTAAFLSDERFDFSDAYVIMTGCGGSAEGYGILGDVFLITSTVDYDLGHHADPREMEGDPDTTWFRDENYDDSSFVMLNEELMDSIYSKVKDVPLETTELTSAYLEKTYPGEEWANREPEVLRGSSATGDNFWKGRHDHNNALLMAESYGCSDPYAITDMEDIAVCQAVDRFGMLDRLIILRDSVNMDNFAPGVTPEKLWGKRSDDELASDDSKESFDIFETAMKNNFEVGKIVIEAILNDEL